MEIFCLLFVFYFFLFLLARLVLGMFSWVRQQIYLVVNALDSQEGILAEQVAAANKEWNEASSRKEEFSLKKSENDDMTKYVIGLTELKTFHDPK